MSDLTSGRHQANTSPPTPTCDDPGQSLDVLQRVEGGGLGQLNGTARTSTSSANVRLHGHGAATQGRHDSGECHGDRTRCRHTLSSKAYTFRTVVLVL